MGKLSLLEPVALEKTEVLNEIEEFPKTRTGNGVHLYDQSSFSKGVSNQKDYKEHKRKQTNIKKRDSIGSFDCKYCDKKFKQKGSAKRHEKTYHTKGGSIKGIIKA